MRHATRPKPDDQPDLFHPCPITPQWAQLPPEVRRQTVCLLVQLMRQHRRGSFAVAVEQEVRDE
jgi:hypothetical protein